MYLLVDLYYIFTLVILQYLLHICVLLLFILWRLNEIQSINQSITIVPMTSFTLKSTSKLRSFLHFRYSIVIPRFIPQANNAQL